MIDDAKDAELAALLLVKRGPNAGWQFLLHRPLTTAGRHPESNIFLDDPTVSRRHAEFRFENGELHVVDVHSLNGTYVNGEPVQSALLANGDRVQIGNFGVVCLTGPAADIQVGARRLAIVPETRTGARPLS